MQLLLLLMRISATVNIDPSNVTVDGTVRVNSDNVLRAAYDQLDLGYSRFFKMDPLCRVGIIGVEYLVREHSLAALADDRIALVFNNSVSSMASDTKHERGSSAGTVSPSVFVYTLPNIVLGEISIRHKWYGEQLTTVSEQPDSFLLYELCDGLISADKADVVILISINATETTFDGKLVLLNNDESGTAASPESLAEILNDVRRA